MSDVAVVAERLWSRVIERPNGCKEWTGSTNPKGYGQIYVSGKTRGTHRLAWEIINGTIPVGLHVLHHCDNPSCVNVDHLWLGTNADNVADKEAKGRGGQKKKTHCPQDHPYDEANTYVRPDGARYCKICMNAEVIRYREANREVIAKRQRQYYAANREAINERIRPSREANREERNKRQREAYRAARESLVQE